MGPPEGGRKPDAVEPRLLDTTLVLVVARAPTSLALAPEPDMSLKRLVVPRVAPILDGAELVAAAGVDDAVEVSVLVPEVAGAEDTAPENVR
jgi:hypothetical protein